MTVKLYRITCGSIVLLIVDLIWVLSSELTEYLYKDKKYNKPFFSTYVKTSLFTIYLLGFIVLKSWRQQCYQLIRCSVHLATNGSDIVLSTNGQNCGQQSSSSGNRMTPLYSVLDQNSDHSVEDSNEENDNSLTYDRKDTSEWEQVLSEPIWVPIKFSSCDSNAISSEKSSGTESDSEKYLNSRHKSSHTSGNINGNQKSVRFSKLTEVRHLSESQAEEALLSRLSYQASLRAQEQLFQRQQQNVNKLSISETLRLSLVFSSLWFLANWSYQLALKYSEAGLVNLLSSTSSLFTILLSPIFPSNSSSDNFSLTKLVAVVVSVGSVAVISTAQSREETIDYIPIGALWALSGAFFYAAYIVLLRYKVNNEESIDIPMFFGNQLTITVKSIDSTIYINHRFCRFIQFGYPLAGVLHIRLQSVGSVSVAKHRTVGFTSSQWSHRNSSLRILMALVCIL